MSPVRVPVALGGARRIEYVSVLDQPVIGPEFTVPVVDVDVFIVRMLVTLSKKLCCLY